MAKSFGKISDSFDFKTYFEANQTITLYRGDPSRYKTHSLSKGDTDALFGQGIYLTNNRRIAGDYTVKGNQDVIFRCSGCKTKQSVIDAFTRSQATFFDENGKSTYYQIALPPFVDDPIRLKRLEYARKYWDGIKKDYEIRINIDGNSVIRKKDSGHISIYKLPIDLVNNTYNTEEEIDDDVLTALCRASRTTGNNCNEIYELVKEDEYGFKLSFRKVWTELVGGSWGRLPNQSANSQEFQTAFRQEMKRLGYKGLSYYGGLTMGGGVKHQAYVFWDEQGLTKYRSA